MVLFKTHYYFLIFLVLFLVFFTFCQKEIPSEDKMVTEEKRIDTISIWDGVALRAEPRRTGKWLASISLGERVFWLGESQIDSTNDQYEYLKVELSEMTIWSTVKSVPSVRLKMNAPRLLNRPHLYKWLGEKSPGCFSMRI